MLAVALLVLAGSLFWLLRGAGGEAPAIPPADPRADAKRDEARGPAPTDAPRTAAQLDATTERRLRGRLLGAYGEALAGAMVGEAAAAQPERTDADGSFALGVAAGAGEVTLLALAAGHAPLATTKPLRADAGDFDLGDVQLRLGGSVRGRAVDEAQNGLPDVEVRVQSVAAIDWPAAVALDALLPIVRTGSDGGFTFGHLPPGSYRLAASADGRQAARSPTIAVADGAEATAEPLVLATGYRLTGTVLGPDERPVAGAHLRVRAAAGQARVDGRADSAADGGFAIAALPTGALRLDVQKDGFLRTELTGVDAAKGEPLVVRLAAGLQITGTVLDAGTRAPVERFAVSVVRVGDFAPNTNGSIEQQLARQAEALRLEAAAAGDDAARTQRAGIAQQFETRLAGLREHQRDRPVAVPDEPGDVRAWPGGGFTVDGLVEGVYTVGIASPDHRFARSASVEVRRGAATPAVGFELQRGFTIRGLVVAKPEGAPVGGATVELVRIDERPAAAPPTHRALFPWLFATAAPPGVVIARTRTSGDGAFTFHQMAPGGYFVAVRHEQCADHDAAVFSLQQDLPSLRVEVQRRAALQGRVTGVQATQVGNVQVLVLGGHGVQRTARAQRDGSYRFDALQPGEYYVRAFPADNKQYVSRFFGSLFPEHAGAVESEKIPPRDVVLAAGETRTLAVPFDLPAAGTIAGTASINGQPGARSRIVLRPLPGAAPGAGGLSLGSTADDHGAFAIRDVPAGDYELVLHGPTRQELLVQRVTVRPGEAASCVCSADAGGLRGRITAADGTPAAELRGYVWVLPGAKEEPADLYEYRRTNRTHRIQVRDGAFEDGFLTPGPSLVVTDLRGRRRSAAASTVPAAGVSELALTAGPR